MKTPGEIKFELEQRLVKLANGGPIPTIVGLHSGARLFSTIMGGGLWDGMIRAGARDRYPEGHAPRQEGVRRGDSGGFFIMTQHPVSRLSSF
jgi:hypothetical protein